MKSRKPDKKRSPTYIHTDISIGGHAIFRKTLYVHEAAKFQGEFDVAGRSKFNSSLAVGGESIFKDNGCFEKDLTVEKRITSDELATIHLSSNSINAEKISVADSVYVMNELDVSGDVYLRSITELVSVIINEKLHINGYAVISKSFRVGGSSVFDGNSSFKLDVNVEGDCIFDGALTVKGEASILNGLKVNNYFVLSGNAKIAGNLEVKKSLNVNENLTVLGGIKASNIVVEKNIQAKYLIIDNVIKSTSADIENICADYVKVAKELTIENANVKNDLAVYGNLSVDKEILSSELIVNTAIVKDSILVHGDVVIKKDIYIGKKAIIHDAKFTGEVEISNGKVKSGVYDPMFYELSNVNYCVVYPSFYTQIGDVIHVNGRIDIEPEDEDVASLEITIPIESKFTHIYDLIGNGTSQDTQSNCVMFANPLSGLAKVTTKMNTKERKAFFYYFSYRVLNEKTD